MFRPRAISSVKGHTIDPHRVFFPRRLLSIATSFPHLNSGRTVAEQLRSIARAYSLITRCHSFVRTHRHAWSMQFPAFKCSIPFN